MRLARPLGLIRRLGLIAAAGAATLAMFVGDFGALPGEAARAQPATARPPAPLVRLISQTRYQNSIAQLFGPDIEMRVRFAPVNRVDGLLAVGAANAALTSSSFDPLEAMARSIAQQVVHPDQRAFVIPCTPADVRRADPACASQFFSRVGRRLFRRPLTTAELQDFTQLAGSSIDETGDFHAGLAHALAGMLMSPEFLFIRENHEPDPAAPGRYRLDGYSKASRLSFLLWDSAPDDALLDAAARGDLHSKAGLARQIDRMMASPLHEDGVRAFFSDFMQLEGFDTLTKDSGVYPALTLKAIAEAREQLLLTIVDHLVTRRGDYRDLYTTRRTFLSSDLGALYRIPVDLGSQGWAPYELPPNDPRAGILTQIGFLSQHAHATRSSATRRGRAVREVLLCQQVPDPPPNVDFSNFEDPAGEFRTARERLSAHNENPVCAGCHRVTDPIGLALENFDGAGQFRTAEGGDRIDASGELDGVAFKDATGFAAALRDNVSLKSCAVSRLFAYGLGRKLDPALQPALDRIQAALDRRGYRFDDMLRLIINDDSFFAPPPAPKSIAALNLATRQGGKYAD